jgi:hypothetical protein
MDPVLGKFRSDLLTELPRFSGIIYTILAVD